MNDAFTLTEVCAHEMVPVMSISPIKVLCIVAIGASMVGMVASSLVSNGPGTYVMTTAPIPQDWVGKSLDEDIARELASTWHDAERKRRDSPHIYRRAHDLSLCSNALAVIFFLLIYILNGRRKPMTAGE